MSKNASNHFVQDVVINQFGEEIGNQLCQNSQLIQYLAIKTKSVNSSSKARGSFANLYALYVLIEDYINKDFHHHKETYSEYEGMMFSDAFNRQRELPFGDKLQNHALNNRCNDEFKKYFNSHTSEIPITRNLETKRYWINEKLLIVPTTSGAVNISEVVIEIINKYMELKIEGFQLFFSQLETIKESYRKDPTSAKTFILNSLRPEADARIFEIVSFAILKCHYIKRTVVFGFDEKSLKQYPLTLFKTGRTNANDGGIDFIMVPTGRIFQVTEVLDFKKYFLDINKINHFPITFVVKQVIKPEDAMKAIATEAKLKYSDTAVLEHYLSCFEEIITLPVLTHYLEEAISAGQIEFLIDELILQCKVEYNISDNEPSDDDNDD